MKRSAKPLRVVIIGGGVIGLSLAYELAGRGAGVVLLERGELGREASGAGAGILTPADARGARRPKDRLRALSHRLIERWSRELSAATGIDNGYRRCGALEVATRPEELPALERTARDWREQGVEVQEVEPAALARLEPALTHRVQRAFRIPGEAQIDNSSHLSALASACAMRGVELQPRTPVLGFASAGGTPNGILTPRGTVSGDAYAVACGAWSGPLLAPLGLELDTRPMRGQIALLEAAVPPLSHVVWCGSRYLVPRPDGRVLVGSTEEDAGFEAMPTAAGVRDLLNFALELAPALAQLPFARAWAGLRPGSADGLPYLGKVPGHDSVYLATGHYRAGLELATGTARVMAQSILGESPEIPLEAFRPDRPAALGSPSR